MSDGQFIETAYLNVLIGLNAVISCIAAAKCQMNVCCGLIAAI